ncbi:condensation domain-containing protein [Kitasatospora phosalacinea]|uniref:Phthiocerol/phthiodiolone dimycocerosyl transferase n=1 Tax=Kitasatospora phosalacinea TaxID=2065 RepID=A0ABW6GJT4_9ACTN
MNRPTAAPAATRPLSPLERWYWVCDQVSPLNVIGHVRVAGPLTEELLAQALDALQQRHPLLRVAIRADRAGRHPRFVPAPGRPVPLRVEPVAALGDAWERLVDEQELATPVDWRGGPLARAAVLSAGDAHDLVITMPHCVADGTTVLTVLQQWIELAAELRAAGPGAGIDPGSARALPAPEALLPPSHRGFSGLRRVLAQQFADQGAARKLKPRRMEAGRHVPFAERTTRLLHRELSADRLADLIAACRREQTTVHGALAAAMVAAVAEDAGLPAGPVMIGSPVNFRDRLVPQVTGREIGTYVASVPTVVDHRPGAPLWAAARTVSRDVARRRSRGEQLAAIAAMGLVSPKSVEKSGRFLRFMEEKGPMTLCLSNIGRHDFPAAIGPWQLSRAEFVAGLSVNALYCGTVNTSHGRMAWNFTHVADAVTAERARRIADASLDAVLSAAKST